nr:immunoglobulin heavy chain junction region [Macaca mulatta]MOW86160.1 immunoglobulin heavy chain junction region [Macaca mulatta]
CARARGIYLPYFDYW